MLRDLTIKNYRAFKDFSIDGLARVNLIVGKNNAGKTSFLEAVYLLVNQSNPFCLLELLFNRGEFIEQAAFPRLIDYPMKDIFRGHTVSFNVDAADADKAITISTSSEMPQKLHIEAKRASLSAFPHYRQTLRVAPATSADIVPSFELAFLYGEHGSNPSLDADLVALPLTEAHAFRTTFSPLDKTPGMYQFTSLRDWYTPYLGKLWDNITLTPQEDDVIEALRILDPRIERINFSGDRQSLSGVIVKLNGASSPVPLSSMGEGMTRILSLILSATMATDGVLLVDEIDTGLYHGAQTAAWQLLLKIARRHNIQVFATTHNWDCVEAFQEALAESAEPTEGKLFRLQRRGDKIYPVDYSIEQLGVAVRHAIEVR